MKELFLFHNDFRAIGSCGNWIVQKHLFLVLSTDSNRNLLFSTVKLGASLLKGKTPALGNIKSFRQFLTILAGSYVSSGFGCTNKYCFLGLIASFKNLNDLLIAS